MPSIPTTETYKAIRRLHEQGKTCAQIAAEIGGGITREKVNKKLQNWGLRANLGEGGRRNSGLRVEVQSRDCAYCRRPMARMAGESPWNHNKRATHPGNCREGHRLNIIRRIRPWTRIGVSPSSERQAEMAVPSEVKFPSLAGLPEAEQIEMFLRLRGVTECRTMFATPTAGAALSGDDAAQRIAALKVIDDSDWRRQRDLLFGNAPPDHATIGG